MTADETHRLISEVLEELCSFSLSSPLTRVDPRGRDRLESMATAYASLPGARWVRVDCDRGLCVQLGETTLDGDGAGAHGAVDPEQAVPATLARTLADRLGDVLGRPPDWQPAVIRYSPELVLAPLHAFCTATFESDRRPLVVTLVGP